MNETRKAINFGSKRIKSGEILTGDFFAKPKGLLDTVFSNNNTKVSIKNFICLDGCVKRRSILNKIYDTTTDIEYLSDNYCIANRDLTIEENFKDYKNFAIYGDATINQDINCDVLFVDGDLIINSYVSVKLLIVTGNLVAKSVAIEVASFYVGKSLTVNGLFIINSNFYRCFVKEHCIIKKFIKALQGKRACYLTVEEGNLFCNQFDWNCHLTIWEGACKIANIVKILTIDVRKGDFETDTVFLISDDIKCNDLKANTINCKGDIICKGKFFAIDVKADKISVEGNFQADIVEAKKVTIYGEIIKAKDICTFDFNYYHHHFN